MIDERRQFQLLYRSFLMRFLDLELLSAQGAMHNLLSQIAAVLAGLSFVLALFKVPQYYFAGQRLTSAQMAVAAWGDQEFLISTTMAVIGIFTVLMWDTLFPDRRDCLVLGPLPVRLRTIFAAKTTAIAAALGLTIVAVNAFTGLSYPFLVVAGDSWLGIPRAFLAYWGTMTAAGLFLFAALLVVQGLALHVMSHGRFLRFTSYLQLAAFFVVVSTYFLMPPLANPRALAAPENQTLLRLLPPFWFLGLYQVLNGAAPPVMRALAERAAGATVLAAAIAGITYAGAYGRYVKRIVEQSGIVPADRARGSSAVLNAIARPIFPRHIERAVFLFIVRTLARSRQHRMLLAIYGAVGLSIALLYLRELIYHPASWTRPDAPLLAIGVIMLFFPVIGVRMCFAIPQELRANWIFRLTEAERVSTYRAAIRKTLALIVIAPPFVVSAMVYAALWPWWAALGHLLLLSLLSVLVVELALRNFRKMPFTCSYLPGQANLKVSLGAYLILLLAATDLGVKIELACLGSPRAITILAAIVAAAIWWTRRRSEQALVPPYDRLLFDQLPPSDVNALDLHADAVALR